MLLATSKDQSTVAKNYVLLLESHEVTSPCWLGRARQKRGAEYTTGEHGVAGNDWLEDPVTGARAPHRRLNLYCG
jgi:hypothetical protein